MKVPYDVVRIELGITNWAQLFFCAGRGVWETMHVFFLTLGMLINLIRGRTTILHQKLRAQIESR